MTFTGYHNSDTPRPRADYQEDQSSVVYSQGPSGPKKQRFHPIQDDRYSPGFENQGAQNFFTHSVTGPSSNRRNPQLKKCLSSKSSESHTTVSSDRNDNELATQESSRTETDQMDKTVNVSLSVSEPFGPSGTWSSDTGEGDITQNSNVPGTDHEQSDDSNLDSSVKIEPVTEDEELEITGIEMTGSASGVPGDWAPNVAGGLGYQSVLHEDDVLNQSGSQFSEYDYLP